MKLQRNVENKILKILHKRAMKNLMKLFPNIYTVDF